MATREELERALRNAHKAGDETAARRLAVELQRSASDANTVLTKTPVEPTPSSEFDKLPPLQKLLTAGSDIARIGSNAVTLGARDRFAGILGGGTPEEERAKTAEARERTGSAAIMTDLLGMFLPAVGASKAVGAAIPAISNPTLIPSLLREGLAGTAVGATQAALQEEPIGRGALVGGLGGLGGTMIGNTATNLLGRAGLVKDVRVPRKTMGEQKAEKDWMYEDIEKSGIEYDPADVGALAGKMRKDLFDAGVDPELHAPAVRRAKKFAQRNPTQLREFDNQRHLIERDVQGPYGVSEMGRIMREDIDEFIKTTPPKNAHTLQANRLVDEARGANRKLKVREGVERAIEKNLNAPRESEGPFRTLLNQGTRGYSDKEAELLKNVVRGEGIERKLADTMMGMAGRVGSIGTGATAGGLLAGPWGAGIGATVGLAGPPLARALSKKQRDKAVEALLDELGGGSTAPSWLKKLLKNTKGAAGVSGFDQYIEQQRKR